MQGFGMESHMLWQINGGNMNKKETIINMTTRLFAQRVTIEKFDTVSGYLPYSQLTKKGKLVILLDTIDMANEIYDQIYKAIDEQTN